MIRAVAEKIEVEPTRADALAVFETAAAAVCRLARPCSPQSTKSLGGTDYGAAVPTTSLSCPATGDIRSRSTPTS